MRESARLAEEFSTPARSLIPIGNKVIADFSPLDGKLRLLKVKELRFEHFFKTYFPKFVEGEMGFEEAVDYACQAAHLNTEWALKYLSSPRYRRWSADRVCEIEAALGLTQGYVMKKVKENIESGKMNLSARDSLNKAADRVWPAVQRIEQKVQAVESFSMDELLEERKKVDELEKKLVEGTRE